MLELLGEPAAASARRDAQTVMDDRDRAGQGLADARGSARSLQAVPQDDARASCRRSRRRFAWKAYLAAGDANGRFQRVNVTEPAFFKELEAQLKSRSLDDWKTYLRWHLAHAKRAYLSSAFVNGQFRFLQQDICAALQQMQPRWKRCVQRVDRDLGEALGQVFVAEDLRRRTPRRAPWR